MTTSPPCSRPTADQLLEAARTAASRAYAPYSSFPVGAALLTGGGRVVTCCNVENAAYPLGLCAERGAVSTMVAADETDRTIAAVAIVGLRGAPCYPCGGCRQVLREFGCIDVIVESEDGTPISIPFETLLPHSFGPESLNPTPTHENKDN
ncbi:Cytidine deaminase [Dermatophilus congolensis]|uniref:Cytidine deaminase n=1 Tax=Dermatophilus congolensis TaxID=1863 RepID=A0A239VEC4_9MICO|nr:cytidine deaminase [Dermatophilus congolensis]SNV20487.1 Cytidine deaminase [Dermatophilus congolensis]STD05300.1 Cytidine deaminase [Dermatophilus congolensis]